MNPGPAIPVPATSPLAGSASTSACASARGLVRAPPWLASLTSSIAALVEKSPWLRSRGRSITKSGTSASAGRVPASRRLWMAWTTRPRRLVFTNVRGSRRARTLYPRPRAGRGGCPASDPAAHGQRHRRPVADDEVVQQSHVHQCQRLLELGG